jgi:uncharacterized protein YjiS (DUF1127 family)
MIASAARIFQQLESGATRFLASVQQAQRSARGRATLHELSDDQLEDVGIKRWAMRPRKPSVEIEAGLMTRLMSMR